MEKAENLIDKYVHEHQRCVTIMPNYPEEAQELAQKHPDKKIGEPIFDSYQAYQAHWDSMREFARKTKVKLAHSAQSAAQVILTR